MNTITLTFPEPLLHLLENLARNQGKTLSDYIQAELTRHVSSAYRLEVVSDEKIAQDQQAFAALLQRLGTATEEEIDRALDEGAPGEWEPELTPEVVLKFQAMLEEKKRLNRPDLVAAD